MKIAYPDFLLGSFDLIAYFEFSCDFGLQSMLISRSQWSARGAADWFLAEKSRDWS